jgi:hypothetical protein
MQNLTDAPSRPPFLKRLFNWRTFGRCLIGIAILATLLAALYAEENWRGKNAWEKYKREAEARGVEFDWHKVIPPAVPDDQNFAMTSLLAPLYDFNPLPLKAGQSAWRNEAGYEYIKNLATNLPTDPHSITPEKLNTLLKPYQPVMQELIDASHRPYAHYKVDYTAEDPQSILLPHLMIVKKLVGLFEDRAVSEVALKNTDAAAANIDMSFYLARTIKGEPFLISHLVHMAALNMACVPIRDGLAGHGWSDEQLKHFEMLLEPVNELKDFSDAIKGERAIFGIRSFDLMRSHPGNLDPFANQINLMPPGWAYLEQRSYHRQIDEKILSSFDVATHRVYPQKADQISVIFPKTLSGRAGLFFHHNILSAMMSGSFFNSLQKSAYNQTKVEQLLIVCALERYRIANGNLPKTLDALAPKFINQLPHDICTGGPLKYRRVGDDQFTLYSVGWNQTDDGGKSPKDSKFLHVSDDDWLWSLTKN